MRLLLSSLFLALPVVAVAGDANPWFDAGQTALKAAMTRPANTHKAKNVILFLGDGMSIATINAARVLDGQNHGHPGEENRLSFESFPYTGLVKTYNTDAMVPDSAGTMSAIMTGVKTKSGVLSVDDGARLGHCDGPDAHRVPTLLEDMAKAGKLTGVVTTTRFTHATPAATYAHSPDRDWEADSDIGDAGKKAGCTDIASQFLAAADKNHIAVAFGGGREKFLPETVTDPEYGDQHGERKDGRNLITEWQKAHPSGQFVYDEAGFSALKAGAGPVFGLFEPSHMNYEADRGHDKAGEPALHEMTAKAIELLKASKTGFFLMVEGGRIDHAHHAGNARRALEETIEFAKAVKVAMDTTNPEDTLIVVTADHGHTMSFAGAYAPRGNPVLGLVTDYDNPMHGPAKDLNGKPISVLNYVNGPGYGQVSGPAYTAGSRPDLSKVDTTALDHRQESLVPLKSETHSAEDVAVFARGPWAQLFTGSLEQNVLFHFMAHAAGLDPKP